MFPSRSTFRLESDPCAHGSVGISRRRSPAKVWDPRGACPAYVRNLRRECDGFSTRLKTALRNDHGRTCMRASTGVSCLASVVFPLGLLGSMHSVSPISPQALLRGFSGALRLRGHLLPRPSGSRSPKTNRAPRTRSRGAGDFFWVPPRKLTLALGAGPTRMAAPRVP
jgi:hypothetical protein